MGYALFSSRKLYYTDLIFQLQQKLDKIAQERQDLLEYSSSIADGVVTSDELANDLGNMDNYAQYNAGLQQYQLANPFMASTTDENGNTTSIDIATYIYGENATAEQQILAQQYYNNSLAEKYAQNIQKQLNAIDNKLEIQQKKIETQLSAAQSQLQAVESAEGQAIQSATPKFTGVG